MGASNADYERQFKEIVAKAKAVYGTGAYDDSTLEFLIPGLRESEDERNDRMRGRVIESLVCYRGKVYDEGDKEVALLVDEEIAWMKKQKEHQNNSDAPNESSWSGIISSSDKDKNLDEIAQDYVEAVKEYNPEPTWDLMQTAVCYGYHLAEQKEQKPIQTSEEKEYIRTLKSLISDFIRDKQPEDVVFYQKIYDWLDGRHIEQKPNIELIQRSWYMEGYHDREFGKEPKWIIKTGEGGPRHELNPRYGQPLAKEQKPVEWSEEDENSLEYIHELISFGYEQKFMDAQTAADMRAWVNKSLKNRGNFPKSNTNSPNEWSEEDEERLINTSISFLKDFADIGYENAVECIDWLKSLRPSWKPTYEQMEALRKAVNKLADTEVSDSVRLSIIYDHLKELV